MGFDLKLEFKAVSILLLIVDHRMRAVLVGEFQNREFQDHVWKIAALESFGDEHPMARNRFADWSIAGFYTIDSKAWGLWPAKLLTPWGLC